MCNSSPPGGLVTADCWAQIRVSPRLTFRIATNSQVIGDCSLRTTSFRQYCPESTFESFPDHFRHGLPSNIQCSVCRESGSHIQIFFNDDYIRENIAKELLSALNVCSPPSLFTNYYLWCWGLNPRPRACEATALPPSHVPSPTYYCF